jgi:glucose-6-phosphate dehydrogenase assembly protein OpcA
MTLIVIAEASDDMSALGETIAALMPQHPARAILIRMTGPGERALSDRVYQQCWMPFGQRRQICCEQIEITASDSALADLPSVLVPLAVPDLPVIVWCRSPRVAGLPEFRDLTGFATKVIIDTSGAGKPAQSLDRLAQACRGGWLIADLAWTRLTRWRESLARLFENREYLGHLSQIKTVNASFPSHLESSAWYLAGWAGQALHLTPTVSGGAKNLRLDLSSPAFQVSLERQDERLVTTVDGQSKCASLPESTDYLVMREELSIVHRDPVFEQTLAFAARLALSSSPGQ